MKRRFSEPVRRVVASRRAWSTFSLSGCYFSIRILKLLYYLYYTHIDSIDSPYSFDDSLQRFERRRKLDVE